MDWTVKVPYWDFSEFEHGGIRSADGISESSRFGDSKIQGGFLVDLKLAQVIDPGIESGQTLNSRIVSKTELSPPGSSKKARSVNSKIQSACLVDGCKADLSVCKEYHRRHKVCEPHSKTPQVTINGHKQRFCQQCSRFHSLEEFDEGKRSCRKRLAGHNRRRRKPPAEPLSSSGTLYPTTHRGATMWNFSAPHACPGNAITHPIWAGFTESWEDINVRNKLSNSRLAQARAVPSRKSRGRASSEASSHLPVRSVAWSETSDRMFCDGPEARFVRSGLALSLLSSSSPAQTSSPGPCHASWPNGEPVEPLELVLVGNSSDASEGMFRALSPAMGDYQTSQALPSFWE